MATYTKPELVREKGSNMLPPPRCLCSCNEATGSGSGSAGAKQKRAPSKARKPARRA